MVLFLVGIAGPLIGWLCYRYLNTPFFKMALYAFLFLTAVYFVLTATGNRVTGEEGDLTFHTVAFIYLNILLFRLLKWRRRNWVFSTFVLLLCASMAVVVFLTFATGSYMIAGS